MCRHVAVVGRPWRIGDVLLDEPHGLVTQVDSPRCQLPGVVNRDGWGVAWRFADRWEQRRSTIPFSADHDGQAGLRTLEAPAFMAAIRRASPGAALTVSGNAPFVEGDWAFSLNGFVGGFFEGAGDGLRAQLSDDRTAALAGDADTEVLFGLFLERLDGADPAAALEHVRDLALDAAGDRPSRLNLLASNGTTIWATRWSNSLFTRPGVVASEPWDDDPAWREVPDHSVITVE